MDSIQKGEPFKGIAAKAENEVRADLYDAGRAALVEEQAIRLHTAARLFWHAIQKVADEAQQGNETALSRLDGYIARFGWLAGASLRAWEQVRKEDASKPKTLDYDELVKEVQQDAGN